MPAVMARWRDHSRPDVKVTNDGGGGAWQGGLTPPARHGRRVAGQIDGRDRARCRPGCDVGGHGAADQGDDRRQRDHRGDPASLAPVRRLTASLSAEARRTSARRGPAEAARTTPAPLDGRDRGGRPEGGPSLQVGAGALLDRAAGGPPPGGSWPRMFSSCWRAAICWANSVAWMPWNSPSSQPDELGLGQAQLDVARQRRRRRTGRARRSSSSRRSGDSAEPSSVIEVS